MSVRVVSNDGKFRVEWVDLGEGMEGDYDPDDPDDAPLLRFDTDEWVNGEWVTFEDGSYCTQVLVSTPDAVLARLAEFMVEEIAANPTRHQCAHLSWIHEGTDLTVSRIV